MILDFQSITLITLVSLFFYWLIPLKWHAARIWWLTLTSFLLIMTISPYAAILAFAVGGYTAFASWIVAEKPFPRASFILPILSFLPLIICELLVRDTHPAILLGLSFYTLKSYAVIRDAALNQIRAPFYSIFGTILNYQTFAAGPIELTKPYEKESATEFFSYSEFFYGVYRFFLGVFKLNFLAAAIVSPYVLSITGGADFVWSEVGFGDTWLYAVFSFLIVYLNFSGYSDTAIGLSRLFGVKVRENFNKPFLATNIQDFWQRWHMSLGNWITAYLYVPIVKNTGRPQLAIWLAFSVIGIWHQLTWNYLIWGILHGGALALLMYLKKRRVVKRLGPVNPFERTYGWLITMTFLAIVSTFANESSFQRGISFLGSLMGII